MRERIKLTTHDGSKNALVYIKYNKGFYVFSLKSEFDHVRIGYNNNEILFIDPPGGPMIYVGDNKLIPGFILTKISSQSDGVKLYFKSSKRHDSDSNN